MAQILEELAVQIRADLGNYEQTFQKAAQATRSLDTAIHRGVATTDAFADRINSAAYAQERSVQQARTLRASYAQYQQALRGAGQATANLSAAQRAASDPRYARSVQFIRDRLREIRPASQSAANGTRQLAAANRELATSTGRFDRAISGATGNLKVMAAGFLAAFGAVAIFNRGMQNLERIAGFVLKTNREFQRLDAQLKTALGSAEAARGAFKLIEDFARTTPFEVNNLTEAFVRLSQFGFVPLKDELQGLGSIAASQGREITDLGDAIVSAVNTSVEPIREFGVAAKISGDKMIVSFDGVTETIDRSIPALAEFLAKQGQIGTRADAMSNRMNTLDGAMTGLRNSAGEFARAVGAGGLNVELVEVIRSLDELLQRSDALAGAIGHGLTEAVNAFQGALQRVQPAMSGVLTLMELMSRTNPFSSAVFDRADAFIARARAAGERAAAVSASTENIRSITDIGQLRGLQGDLQKQITELSNPFATSTADRSRLPFLAAQLKAAGEQAALLQSRVDAAGRTFTGFGTSAAEGATRATDAVAKIAESLEQSRREISAMAAATAGTSIEFDKTEELAGALESAIRALSREGSAQAQVLAAELTPEWLAYEAQLEATAAALKRTKQAQEQLNAQRATRREFVSRHEEAVAGFRGRKEQMDFDIALQEMEEMRDVARDIAGTFADGFQSIVNGTETVADAFRKMAQDIIASIQRILIQKALIDPLISSLFGSNFGGVDLGGQGGGLPHFASGGLIDRHQAAIVGEQGPELFVSASAGRIVPNSAMQGGGDTYEIHLQQSYEVRAIDTRDAVTFIRQMQPEIAAVAARGMRQAPGLAAMVRR